MFRAGACFDFAQHDTLESAQHNILDFAQHDTSARGRESPPPKEGMNILETKFVKDFGCYPPLLEGD